MITVYRNISIVNSIVASARLTDVVDNRDNSLDVNKAVIIPSVITTQEREPRIMTF